MRGTPSNLGLILPGIIGQKKIRWETIKGLLGHRLAAPGYRTRSSVFCKAFVDD